MKTARNPRTGAHQLSLFEQETVSVPWAARYLRVSTVTVMRYREQGLLRGYQMAKGGWWRLTRQSLVDFEASLARQLGEEGKTA